MRGLLFSPLSTVISSRPQTPYLCAQAQERNELRDLRRENKQLKLEREILGKAAAWFARESITLPKPSDS